MDTLEKTFEAGTHWKELYFKQDVELGKIPDFQKYLFSILTNELKDNKLPQPWLNEIVTLTNKDLHKIAIEKGYYEIIAIRNELVVQATKKASEITAEDLDNTIKTIKLCDNIITFYKSKIKEFE